MERRRQRPRRRYRAFSYLLVDDDEALVAAVAHLSLELDDLLDARRRVLALGLHQPLALRRRLVEDARVHLPVTSSTNQSPSANHRYSRANRHSKHKSISKAS